MFELMPPFYFLTFAKVSVSVSKKFGLKEVSVSVSKTFGLEKKSRYRSRKHLVSKKSLGISLDSHGTHEKCEIKKLINVDPEKLSPPIENLTISFSLHKKPRLKNKQKREKMLVQQQFLPKHKDWQALST